MQIQTSAVSAGAAAETMDARFISGEAYEVAVRGHTITVDQPADLGGESVSVGSPAWRMRNNPC